MLWFLYFNAYSYIQSSAAINIDDKLDSPFTSDCYKRISIGERLIIYDVTRTSEKKKVKDCENECNLYKCTFFSFGIAASGNGTCELSSRREIARRRDADYDIYQRTKLCTEGKPTGYEDSCYRRLHAGKRLNDKYVRHSLPCDTIQACQHQCSVEQQFECHGFSIRLDESGLGRGVCELTSVPASYFDSVRDFNYDSEFDFYEKDVRNTSPNCGYINEVISVIPKNGDGGGHFLPTVSPNANPTTTPWSRDITSTLPTSWRPPHNFGRDVHPNEIPQYGGFSPKHNRFNIKPHNWPDSRSIPFDNRVPLPGYVIIDVNRNRRPEERSLSYPAPYPPSQHLNPGPNDNFHNNHWDQNHHGQQKPACFQRLHPASSLRTNMIREMHTMSTVMDCEAVCSSAPFSCMGFTFRYSRLPDKSPNCLLTDSRNINVHNDIFPDRDCDVYYRNPSCHNFYPDTDCFTKAASDVKLTYDALRFRISASSVSECELECLRADQFTCRSFVYSNPTIGSDNCQLSDWPIQGLSRTQFTPSPGFQLYERGSFGRGCELDSGPPHLGPNPSTDLGFPRPDYPQNWQRNAWQYFTVRGWPCRRGSQCALNREAGFWSCEVEGGDHAQWDYCCRPQHACGHSQGYSYSWCYVGEVGPDQWRPCSDHFYPNYADHRPRPPSNHHHGHTPWSSEYGPGSSWPISYIYTEPPPNETIYFYPNDAGVAEKPSYYQDESPRIKFKSSTEPTFPKAIGVVQKLDIKNMPVEKPPSVDDEIIAINPRYNYAKSVKYPETSGQYVLAISGSVKTKNSTGRSSNFVHGSTLADFMSSLPMMNQTVNIQNINKTKEILKQIERIIERSTKGEKEAANCSKNESEVMEISSSEGLGYRIPRLANANKASNSNKDDSALFRFWNWGQEHYFSKRSRA